MAKRKKGRGKKRREPITRHDVEKKRAQRESRADSQDAPAEGDGEEEAVAASGAGEDPSPVDDPDGAADEAAEEPWPPERASEPPPPLSGAQPWGAPLLALERKWTWLETRVLFVALMSLTLVLCSWIVLRGMSEPLAAEGSAGTIFRAIAGATLLGALARVGTRRLDSRFRTGITVAAIALGLALASAWRSVGIAYAAGWLDWLQEGSSLTLMGGLKGISTRLTMTVALIGASLAAASGSHINIDVVVRFIPAGLRKAVSVLGALATALVCVLAAWGLFDHIAVAEYHVDRDRSAGEKISQVAEHAGEQWFVWRKQMGLDLGAFPLVATGTKWNAESRMNGRQWNEFLSESGFVERYGEEKVAMVRAPESDLDLPWTPFVVVPGGEARGLLLHAFDLVFPFGFFMIGLRFLLRALLVLAGQVRDDPEGEGGADVGAASAADVAEQGEVA